MRARLAIRLFNSFSVETTLTCFCAERLQSFARTGYAKYGSEAQIVILLPRNTCICDDFGPLYDVATLMGSDSPQLAIIKERDREQAGVG